MAISAQRDRGRLERAAPALDVVGGRALDWHGSGWGTFIEDVPHAFATREVETVGGSADLGTSEAVEPWRAMHSAARAMLASAALMPGCAALELRYTVDPNAGRPGRVRMYVTAKTRSWEPSVAAAAVEAACGTLPLGFTWTTPEDGMGFGQGCNTDPVVELRSHEEVTAPMWSYIPAQYYYVINGDPGDGSGWPRFWSTFAEFPSRVEMSVLFQGTELAWDERNALGAVTTDLARVADAHTEFDAFGNQIAYPADTNAQVALESWNRRIQQLQRPLLARIAVRAPVEAIAAVASAVASAVSGTTDGSGAAAHPMYVEAPQNPRDTRKAAFSFDWLEILPWGGHPIWEEDAAPHTLRRLPYLYGLDQAAGLAMLPVPDDQGVPGFQRARRLAARRAATAVEPSGVASMLLGDAVHRGEAAGPVELPLPALNRHVLVAGAPGSGKTTTVLSVLVRLWRDHQIPFFAIESVKTEYRSLLGVPGLDDLAVIVLGRDDISPLRLNPLAPPAGVRTEVHSGAVMAALKASLPLPPPLPQLLEEALDRTYRLAGWDDDTVPEDGHTPPTLRALLTNFDHIFEQHAYVGEARNIAAAARVRLRSLLRGGRGRMLDTVESDDFSSLLARPVVVELDEIADPEDKAVISAFLLDRIRAGAKARAATGGTLRHVTVLEEAHRLLAQTGGATHVDGGNDPRTESVRAFCDAIGELRAQGEGFILSSLSPAALAPAAVANTGTRILHRLERADDRQALLDDLDASELDRQTAARLRKGEAVVRIADTDDAEVVRIRTATGVDSGANLSTDVVAARMADRAAATRALLPHRLCTREMCPVGCEPDIRSAGQRIATDAEPHARKLWQASNGSLESGRAVARSIAPRVDGDRQRLYCAAVHLSANGAAFDVPNDIRGTLVEIATDAARRP